jgi:hypothetical protein
MNIKSFPLFDVVQNSLVFRLFWAWGKPRGLCVIFVTWISKFGQLVGTSGTSILEPKQSLKRPSAAEKHQCQAPKGRFRVRPSSGCPRTSRAQLEADICKTIGFFPMRWSLVNGIAEKDFGGEPGELFAISIYFFLPWLKFWEKLLGWRPLQLLVGPYCRWALAAAGPIANAVASSSHGGYWRRCQWILSQVGTPKMVGCDPKSEETYAGFFSPGLCL